METTPKLKVGDRLYVVCTGYRKFKGYSTVKKVGRKFFTVEVDGFEIQFHIDDWRQKTDYSPSVFLYKNEESLNEKQEIIRLCGLIKKRFEYVWGGGDFTLDQLKKAVDILRIN